MWDDTKHANSMREQNGEPSALAAAALPARSQTSKNMRSKLNAQPNQSLIDGIRTLQALAVAEEPIGCRELGRQLGFEASKVNRLLKTLAYLGIARQSPNRKYSAGPGMHVLAAQSLFASGLIRRALPILEDLRRLGHTVAMGVLWNDSVSYLFHAPPGIEASRALGRIGVLPATTSGLGMALLAQLDGEDIGDLYENSETIANFPDGLEGLTSQLETIRKQGFARIPVRDNPHTIAVTLGKPAYAAIGMSGWIPDSITEDVVAALVRAVEQIDAGT